MDNPKAPISARPPMISSGMSSLARWMCSARGRICSSAKRWKVSRTELEVGVEMAVALDAAQRRPGTPGRGSGVTKCVAGVEPVRRSSPTPLRARRIRAARSASTSATKAQAMRASSSPVGAVGEGGPGRPHPGGGMGQVVGQDLVGVEVARVGQRPGRPRDHDGRPGRRRAGGASRSGVGDGSVHGSRRAPGGPAARTRPDHGDQRRQDDGVVAGVDPGQEPR